MADKTYYHTIPKSRFVFGGNKDNQNGLAGKIIYFADGKYTTGSAAEQAELDAAIRAGASQLSTQSDKDVAASVAAARAALEKVQLAAPAAP